MMRDDRDRLTASTADACSRCDKPRIPQKAWTAAWAAAVDDDSLTIKQWGDQVVAAWPGHCDARESSMCTGLAVDWRARAKEAEAKLAEVEGGLRDRLAGLEARFVTVLVAKDDLADAADDLNGDNGDDEELHRRREQIGRLRRVGREDCDVSPLSSRGCRR